MDKDWHSNIKQCETVKDAKDISWDESADVVVVGLGAFPTDFDAREQIGLGADGFEQTCRLETVVTEDLLVRVKRDSRAAPIGGCSDLFHGAKRDAAREALLEEFLVARDLHDHGVGQCVHHRGTHTVQTARCLVSIARKLTACVQRAQDDLKRGFVREFGVRINRDTAPVVTDHDGVIREQFHLDAGGMTSHRLIHGVVEHLGHKVMQSALIRAADIHAGALAHRLQAFENLDRGSIVVGRLLAGQKVGHFAAALLIGASVGGCYARVWGCMKVMMEGFYEGDRSDDN